MTDHFALLQEPRRPWLNPDVLKTKFLQLSTEFHPDRFHRAPERERSVANQRYLELNTAYNCLREPKDRLLHLIELERGSRPKDVHVIPGDTMELFMEVARLCQNVDVFLTERARADAPMLQVQMFERAQEWSDKLVDLQSKIEVVGSKLEQDLKGMNSSWEAAPMIGAGDRAMSLPLGRLEQLHRSFSYVSRWQAQLQERFVRLSF